MPKTKKVERGQVTGKADVIRKCIVCKVDYDASQITYANGDIVITPSRCPDCQTAHLTDIRVNKAIKDIQLIGNLKTRLSANQRVAVVEAIKMEFQTMLDRFAGAVVKQGGFSLPKK